MKVGDLVFWEFHPLNIYKIIDKKQKHFQIQLYEPSSYWSSVYWVKYNTINLLTPEEMSQLIAKKLLNE